MPDNPVSYEKLIEKFVAWAQCEENIRAAVVIGSRARADHPADEWSDLDLVVLARDPKPLWESADWIANVGVPWITFVEQTPGDGGFERRVLFEGGLDVDFAPTAAGDLLAVAGQELPPMMADIIARGVKIILDKDGLAELFREGKGGRVPEAPPAEPGFLNCVNDFWYHTVWTGKHLRRGELWWAISCCDMHLAVLLRRMIEWHARATRGPGVDTWMRGRFLEEWADPKAAAALPEVFARYDTEDVWRALRATMKLFHTLAEETAEAWSFSYPAVGEGKAMALVEAMHAGRNTEVQAEIRNLE
jgi:aminoglycoside 6-adenylyltransferase